MSHSSRSWKEPVINFFSARVDLTIDFARIPGMRPGLRKKIYIAVAITVVLQLALITVAPALSFEGLLVKAGDSSIGKPFAHCFPRFRHCANVQPSLTPGKIAGVSGLPLSSAALRFDLKQNLSTWPVLSNRLERSPPLLLPR
jgi:hypothetical protein